MSEQTRQQKAAGSESSGKSAIAMTGRKPRIWPAAVAVLVQAGVWVETYLLAASSIHGLIGFVIFPSFAALLLLVWWLALSRVPLRDRLAGFVLFVGSMLLVYVSQPAHGELVLLAALPVMMVAVVAVLVVTPWLRWPVRRWIAAGVLGCCAIFFLGVRGISMGGNMLPVLSWRWTPTSQELLAMSEAGAGPHLGQEAVVPAQAGPGDWPEFRGPLRDGRCPGVTFATDWAQHPPREVWRRPVGLGWSSFAAVGGCLFTQEQRGEYELVVCYAADTGEEIWANGVVAQFEDPMGSGPRATPTFDEGKIFAQGATGMVLCLDARTGELLWQRDLTKDVDAKAPTWGFCSSPLVLAGHVIVFAGAGDGKGVVAYAKETGDMAWAAGKGTHGYSSAHYAEIGGVPQLLMMSDYGLQAFAPEDGQLLWEYAWNLKGSMRIVQPLVLEDGTVLVGTGTGHGTRRLTVARDGDGWQVDEGWTAKRFRPYFNDFVFAQGYCYGYDGNRFCCLDAATGDIAWKGERWGGQVLLLPDMGVLLVLSEAGEVVLVEAAPGACRIVASIQAIEGKTWNHPVVAQGKLYVRNSDEAACYALPRP